MIRKPVVAGQFYPAEPAALKKLISSFAVKKSIKPQKAISCILPHAGYVYSGKVAVSTLKAMEPADSYIILGPNHTGYGAGCSIVKYGAWSTPFELVNIDTDLASELLKNSKYLEEDEQAHAYEHAIEVELPLIQAVLGSNFSFVPITLATGTNLVYKDIAESIAKTVKNSSKKIMIVASSDMTHYEQQNVAIKKDEEAIKAILELDEQRLLEKIEHMGITMCGYIPAIIAIMAAKKLGAQHAQLIDYQTSGDITGDYSSVVGYAGIVIL
ncbi:MAG: AmmeMemoRadiSam system protein B [Candidatus Omnitrophota bacterium]